MIDPFDYVPGYLAAARERLARAKTDRQRQLALRDLTEARMLEVLAELLR